MCIFMPVQEEETGVKGKNIICGEKMKIARQKSKQVHICVHSCAFVCTHKFMQRRLHDLPPC